MATYTELFGLRNDSPLQDRVAVSVVIAADSVRSDVSAPTNQTERLAWAALAMADPLREAKRMLWALLAQNKDATVANIQGATDTQLQTQTDAAVDLFAGGL